MSVRAAAAEILLPKSGSAADFTQRSILTVRDAMLNLFLIASLNMPSSRDIGLFAIQVPDSVQYLNPQLSCWKMMGFKMAGMLDSQKPHY